MGRSKRRMHQDKKYIRNTKFYIKRNTFVCLLRLFLKCLLFILNLVTINYLKKKIINYIQILFICGITLQKGLLQKY